MITKSALIDQAFSLSQYDIDSLSKYDEQYLKISELDLQKRRSVVETRKVDALQKERIFQYQTQVLASKVPALTGSQSHSATTIDSSHDTESISKVSVAQTANKPDVVARSTSNSLCATPPPNLVAALRRVFDGQELALPSEPTQLKVDAKIPITRSDSGSGLSRFELRNLLQAISNHPVFTTSITSPAVAVATKQEHATTTPSIKVDEQQVNLEKLLMNVTRQLTSNCEETDNETSLQGLLIAIISLLTTSQSGFNVSNSAIDDQKKREFLEETKSPAPKIVERQENDLPQQAMLQVGALLSLLPLEAISTPHKPSTESPSIVDTVAADSASHRLNPELLDYFASVAVIYQERWEIRKARRLARIQTPSPQPSSESVTRCQTPPPALLTSSVKPNETPAVSSDDVDNNKSIVQQQQDSDQQQINSIENAETPTAGDRAELSTIFSSEADDSAFLTPTNNNSATPMNDASENRNVDPPASSNTEPMTIGFRRRDPTNEESYDAVNDDDPGENAGSTVIPFDMAGELLEMASELLDNISRNAVERPDEEHDNDENEDDEADVDEPSSSSGSESSDDDDDDDDDEDGMGDSDDAGVMDTDDEDAAVLRQAMAMSIVEHEEINVERQAELSAVDAVNANSQIGQDANAVAGKQNKDLQATESRVSQNAEDNPMQNEDDDANLPPFPNPSASYHFLLRTGSTISEMAPEWAKQGTETSVSQLDPSKLSDFGSIPSCYVLFHLLRYAKLELDQRLSIYAKARSSPVVVPGGVGSSLFASDRSSADYPDSTTDLDKKGNVTIQLLVASTLLMIERRDDAIENLRKSMAREQRMAHDGTYDAEDENSDVNGDDESSRFPISLSGEEDDPALTLAMNYVEDDAPLSSESLESKGMTRKAAAAAYDAAAMMKSLQKRTNSWKYEVHLTSCYVACSLQILSMYLQSIVRQYFLNAESAIECTNHQSVADFQLCLPDFVKANISQGLSSLMSIGTQSSLLAMLSGDVTETERLFQSCCLYREALVVWGESIPLLNGSEIAQSNLLRSLVCECSGLANRLPHLKSLVKFNDFPNSDLETQFYKVSTMCKRLRVGDLLDGFVSRPIHFIADMSMDSTSDGNDASQSNAFKSELLAKSVADLITFLSNSVGSLVGDCSEIDYFYLALCHRCQSQALLLDGLYLETDTELDDRHNLSAAAKTLSTGDTVRVASNPSAALQFDATKCSDSIAVYTGQDDDSRILSAGIYSVHQRASKVWGTVLSTQQYSPKSGVHRWAVRLDKCERGHVFIGVATSQATMKTYVGGDKYGWGMIGTQALWHDRRKVDVFSVQTLCYECCIRLTHIFVNYRFEVIMAPPLGQVQLS